MTSYELKSDGLEDRSRWRSPASSKEGWMWKKGWHNRRWKKRWFVLVGDVLNYFEQPEDMMCKGNISLAGCVISFTDKIDQDKKRKYQFSLTSPSQHNRSYQIYTDTAEDRTAWLEKIKQAIQNKDDSFDDRPSGSPKLSRNQVNLSMDPEYLRAIGIPAKISQWRSALSLKGLNDRRPKLFINKLHPEQQLRFASALTLHPSYNCIATGNSKGANSEIQIIRVSSTRSDFLVVHKFLQQGPCLDFSWFEDKLLCSSVGGKAFLYNCNASTMLQPTVSSLSDNILAATYTHPGISESSIARLESKRVAPTDLTSSLMPFAPSAAASASSASSAFIPPTTSAGNSSRETLNGTASGGSSTTTTSDIPFSTRVRKAQINPIDQAHSFLSLANETFYLWNMNQERKPLFSEKGSSSALYACAWDPFNGEQFVIGGENRSLKMLDRRQLLAKSEKCVVWKVPVAHESAVRDIAWSPLVPYWIATAGDDGCVRVWDIRFGHHAARVLRGHTNGVTKIAWSKSRVDMLLSASTDRTLRLWNLRVQPHYQMTSYSGTNPNGDFSSGFSSAVIGCGFSSVNSLQYFGMSSYGELKGIEMEPEFLTDYVLHRPFADTSLLTAPSPFVQQQQQQQPSSLPLPPPQQQQQPSQQSQPSHDTATPGLTLPGSAHVSSAGIVNVASASSGSATASASRTIAAQSSNAISTASAIVATALSPFYGGLFASSLSAATQADRKEKPSSSSSDAKAERELSSLASPVSVAGSVTFSPPAPSIPQTPSTLLASKGRTSQQQQQQQITVNEQAEADELREIERLLYLRDIATASNKLAKLATVLWDTGRKDRLGALLKLCSPANFEYAMNNPGKSFTKLLNDLSYYVPSHSLQLTKIEPRDHELIEALKVRLAVLQFVEEGKYKEILELEDKILSHLQTSSNDISTAQSLENLAQALLPHEYLRTLELFIRIGTALKDLGQFSNFTGVARILFYPTIYDSLDPSFQVEPQHAKNAKFILDRDLRNSKLVLSQLELLLKCHAALNQPNSAKAIVSLMEEQDPKKILPACVHRLYYNALLQLKKYDILYVVSNKLAEGLQNFEFGGIITSILDDVTFPKLKSFLDTFLLKDPRHPWQTDRKVAASLTIINIFYNCEYIPQLTLSQLPDYLRRFSEQLQIALKEMVRHPNYEPKGASGAEDAKATAEAVLAQVAGVRENREVRGKVHHEDLIHQFTAMLQKFVGGPPSSSAGAGGASAGGAASGGTTAGSSSASGSVQS